MDLGLDIPDLDHPDLFRLNAVKAALDETRARLILDGVCRSDVIGLESLVRGVMHGANPNSFTQNTSNTKLNIALEAIDLKRFAIIGTAVTIAIGLLLKFFYWLKEAWVQFRAKQVTDAAMQQAEHRLIEMRDFLAAEIAKEAAEPDVNGDAGNLITKYGVNAYSRFIYMYLANEIRRKTLSYKDAEKICTEIAKVDNMQGTSQDDIIRYAFIYGLISSKSAHIQPITAMLLPGCRPKDVAKLTNINYTTGITYGYLEEILELVEGTFRAAHEKRDMLHYVEGISMKLRDFCNKFNPKGSLPYSHIWHTTFDVEERTVSDGKGGLRKIIYPRNHQVALDPSVNTMVDYYRDNRSRRYGLWAWDADTGLESFDREGVQLLNTLTQQSQRDELAIYLRKLKTLAQNNYYTHLISVLERIEKEHAWFLDQYKAEVYDTVRDHNLVAIKHLSITEVVDNAIAFVKSAIMATKTVEELNLGLAAAADRTLRLYTNAARDSLAFIKA